MSTIKENDIASFCQNYDWPVSYVEFNRFSEFIHNKYIDLALDIVDDNLFDIVIVELSFIHHLIQVLHYNYVKEYSVIHNVKILHSNESNYLFEPNWRNLADFYSSPKPSFGKIKRLIRRMVKNIVFNRKLSIFNTLKSLNSKNRAISIGSMSPLKMEFILSKGVYADHCDYFDIINKTIFEQHFEKYLGMEPWVIGACCGSTPWHIRRIKDMIENKWT